MSGIFSGTIAAGLLATVAMVAAGRDGADPLAMKRAPAADQAYQLQLGGDAHSCVVERGSLDMRGSAALKLNSGCEKLYPGLAGAQRWSEDADGTVAFVQQNGTVVIQFAVSDGAAYESFQPGAPLASLIALN